MGHWEGEFPDGPEERFGRILNRNLFHETTGKVLEVLSPSLNRDGAKGAATAAATPATPRG